jgi:hypothetical protein
MNGARKEIGDLIADNHPVFGAGLRSDLKAQPGCCRKDSQPAGHLESPLHAGVTNCLKLILLSVDHHLTQNLPARMS